MARLGAPVIDRAAASAAAVGNARRIGAMRLEAGVAVHVPSGCYFGEGGVTG